MPDGSAVWWFREHDGSEIGRWMVTPWAGGAEREIAHELEGRARGLVFDDHAAVFAIAVDDMTCVYRCEADTGRVTELLNLAGDVFVHDLDAATGTLLMSVAGQHTLWRAGFVAGCESGEVALDHVVADDRGRGILPVCFLGGAGHALARVERDGFVRPAIVGLAPAGSDWIVDPLDPGFAGDTDARVAPVGPSQDRRMVTLRRTWRGRDELWRVECAIGDDGVGAGDPRWLPETIRRLELPPGDVESWVDDDDRVTCIWSSAVDPPQRRVVLDEPSSPSAAPDSDRSVVQPDRPRSHTVTGHGGPIEAFVFEPATPRPHPTVFMVHGGPAAHDGCRWDPERSAWREAGFCTVQINYRGSTSYGTAWLNANRGAPGLTEVEDVEAVQRDLVDAGVVLADSSVVVGRSWGGYLALLSAGLHPELWRLVLAVVPVGDPALVYDEMFEEIRAAYRFRFGGAPDERPGAYRRASPISYVDGIRAPVYVSAARNDPRCPISQVDAWVDAATDAGADIEYHVTDGGHAARSRAERVEAMQRLIEFVRRRWNG